MLYSYADTLSWSKDKHAFKFGVELRLPRNAGNGGADPYPGVTLGNNVNAARRQPLQYRRTTFPELPGLINSSLVTSTASSIRERTSTICCIS